MRAKLLKSNKNGFGLIIAIAIMAVIMMLSLALLLVSFSLYSTAGRQQDADQSRELAQSLSQELQTEIEIDKSIPYEADAEKKYGLWFYLRYNVCTDSWNYYNKAERGRTADYAFRYFNVDFEGYTSKTKSLTDKMSILMYWESEQGTTDKNGTGLVVSVTSEVGKSKTTITSHYELTVINKATLPADEQEKYKELSGGEDNSNDDINPDNNHVEQGEIWSWKLTERE